MDVIIAIGYGNCSDQQGFFDQVQRVVRRLGTENAVLTGASWSDEWGAERATWFAASFPDFDTYAEARARILAVGAAHHQDAVAFTVGTVDVATCPKPDPKPYRDLL